jgi:hypothetical protein
VGKPVPCLRCNAQAGQKNYVLSLIMAKTMTAALTNCTGERTLPFTT